jgi:hypothetical protein
MLWSADDGVHLAWEAYRDLAAAFTEMAESRDADDDMSCSSEGSKRKHPESVVPLPGAPFHKRGRGIAKPPVAGWLCGMADIG